LRYARRAVPLLALLAAHLACGFGPRTWRDLRGAELRTIDADTILQQLQQGDQDVFAEADFGSWEWPSNPTLVDWDQADFLSIAEAVHRYVWHESMAELHVSSLSFDLTCAQADLGPQQMEVHLVRVSRDGTMEWRLERRIYIRSQLRDEIEWWQSEVYPNVFGVGWIDLARASMTAEAALTIAETNGGAEARRLAADECSISGTRTIRERKEVWLVWYNSGYKTLADFKIDATAGDVLEVEVAE
jgi:hypothetical protein